MQIFRNKLSEIERLYSAHSSALLLFAAAIAGERSRAQDAVHQVFLKLIETGGIGGIVDAKSYLFASVRNAVMNDTKLRQRNVEIDPGAAWFSPPDRDVAAEMNLRRALCDLSDDQRQVTVLHIWGELTFSQIGDVLEISSNTAASRYRYALIKLREALCVTEDFHANSQR